MICRAVCLAPQRHLALVLLETLDAEVLMMSLRRSTNVSIVKASSLVTLETRQHMVVILSRSMCKRPRANPTTTGCVFAQ